MTRVIECVGERDLKENEIMLYKVVTDKDQLTTDERYNVIVMINNFILFFKKKYTRKQKLEEEFEYFIEQL